MNYKENIHLYATFSNIKLDLEGSNIACIGWIPSELDKKYMDDDDFTKAVKQSEEENAKVLFKNVSLKWDSCDCSDGFGCSHGSWVYEIEITNSDKTHTLDVEENVINAYNEGKQTMIPITNSTIYDFYRMCELVGVELELSEYAKRLLKS